jgi:hypothetical protein
MADSRTILITDASGPVLGAVPSTAVLLCCDTLGNALAVPTLVELGDGQYKVDVSDAYEALGVVVLIDCGTDREPRHVTLACYKADNSNQFWAFHVNQSSSPALWNDAAIPPTVGSYRAASGASRTAPALLDVYGGGVWLAVPSAADVAADVSIRINGPSGSAQPYWYGSTEPVVTAGSDATPPVVTLVSPPTSQPLSQGTILTIDVTDNIALRRAFISARFAGRGIEEVVHAGDRFSALYATSSRTAIAGGYRYSVQRAGGWPEAPTLDVYALDTSGLEA